VTSEPTSLRLRVLGPLEADRDGDALVLGGAKQQMVLALLLLEANHVVSTDRLVDWVWGDESGERSPGTLQVYMSNLRRTLGQRPDGTSPIVTRRPGYVIEVETEQLDLLGFDDKRRVGEMALAGGRPAEAVAAFRDALALWRGAPLDGLPIDVSAAGVLGRLDIARLTVIEGTAEAELALGRHRELVDELKAWLSAHPLDERLRGLLMLALYRCGWQAEALSVYREGRELLVEELGLDPSRELRDLEAAILAQDPALDLGAVRDTAGVHPELAYDDASATVLRHSVVTQPAVLEVDGNRVALERPVTTIGRLAGNDVVVADSGVSRRHAEIRRIGSTYRLVDAGSANGTRVGGRLIAEHQLADGDHITVGAATLVFRLR